LAELQWMRSQDPPCPWHNGSCWAAAAGGHLGALQWLKAQKDLGCGKNIIVTLQQKEGTWLCCSGCEIRTRHVRGINRLVRQQLKEAT
jgi:hypothetical protein